MNQNAAQTAISSFARHLAGELGDELRSVMIYGSLAKGDYDDTHSDHNVALVLQHDHASLLRKVASAMRASRPSKKTALLLLCSNDLECARDVLPIKLRDIQRHHIVVHGEEVMPGLRFEERDLVHDCEHQFRSMSIRLRRLFLRHEQEQSAVLENLGGPFKMFLPPLGALCELSGQAPASDKAAIIAGAKKLLPESSVVLDTLLSWYKAPDTQPSTSEANSTADSFMTLLREAALLADGCQGRAS